MKRLYKPHSVKGKPVTHANVRRSSSIFADDLFPPYLVCIFFSAYCTLTVVTLCIICITTVYEMLLDDLKAQLTYMCTYRQGF